MYFPKDMTFKYFFFDTYIGYFLQALPIALLVGIIYYFIKFKNDKEVSTNKKVFSSIFISYITGVISLTIGLDIINIVWYKLIYQMDPCTSINWFNGDFNFKIVFINNIKSETIGNFLMFYLLEYYTLYQKKNLNGKA